MQRQGGRRARAGRCSDRSERGSKLHWDLELNIDLEIELDMDSYLTCELEGMLQPLALKPASGSRYRFAPGTASSTGLRSTVSAPDSFA